MAFAVLQTAGKEPMVCQNDSQLRDFYGLNRPMLFVSLASVQVVDGNPAGIVDRYEYVSEFIPRELAVEKAADDIMVRDRVFVRRLADDYAEIMGVIAYENVDD